MAAKKAGRSTKNKPSNSNVLDYFRFGDSYTSLILGIVVVILAIILLGALFRNRNFTNTFTDKPTQETSSTSIGPETKGTKKTYTVKEGDTLWSIAETTYSDGYRWGEIAKANNITSADIIAVGVILTLPESAEIAKSQGASASSSLSPPTTTPQVQGQTYTVVEGDNLWSISLKAYATGYRWPEIAKLNNISNPDLIYPGTKLKLPPK